MRKFEKRKKKLEKDTKREEREREKGIKMT